MSIFLYRLGRFSYHRPWVFILTWLVILSGVVGLAVTSDAKISSAITINGTQSQAVIDQLRTEFPETSGGQGTIVFTAPEGQRLDSGERAEAIRSAMKEISANEFVVERDTSALTSKAPQDGRVTDPSRAGATTGTGPAQSPAGGRPGQKPSPADQEKMLQQALLQQGMLAPGVLVSADGSVALMQIQFTQQVEDLPAGVVDDVVGIATHRADATGLTALPTESLKPQKPPLGGHEALGLLVAGLVLVLTLGSLSAAGLPLVTGIIGVAIGLGGAFALSGSIELTSATPVLALMIGLAVGLDYALFIVNRQRHLILREGLAAEEAAGRALGTAGSAVAFAGLIVIIALSGLTLIRISFLTTMALVAAATVLCAVLIALTLLPALLGLIGERILSARTRRREQQRSYEQRHGLAHHYASALVKGRWVVIVGVIALLGVAAVPMSQMTLGMPSGATANHDTTERQAADAITRSFGAGYNAPLISVVRAPEGGHFAAAQLPRIAGAFKQDDSIETVRPMGISPDGSLALFSVIPVAGAEAESTKTLVHALREDTGTLTGVAGTSIGVTGLTAINLDISEKLADVLPLYITIIVVLSLLVLLVVFRSLFIPIKATAGFLLTISATFGIMTAIFQWGWLKDLVGFDTPGPILSFLPIMVTGILYGLAMDYEMFLVSSMREAHVHGYEGKKAVVHGFEQASRVVVAAAIIMVSVFAGFIFSDDRMVKQFGLALAVGILIDAFLVRMTLVPALMAVLGKAAWWIPGWLDKLLPNLDIEGDRLAGYLRERESRDTRGAVGSTADSLS
ncbi:MMPL family transporter [Raineyella sp.]|nr:MMPL family transporter [Raineyella sp.]MEA5153500.1 MMPL family transporter [Raineyella sp.]